MAGQVRHEQMKLRLQIPDHRRERAPRRSHPVKQHQRLLLLLQAMSSSSPQSALKHSLTSPDMPLPSGRSSLPYTRNLFSSKYAPDYWDLRVRRSYASGRSVTALESSCGIGAAVHYT